MNLRSSKIEAEEKNGEEEDEKTKKLISDRCMVACGKVTNGNHKKQRCKRYYVNGGCPSSFE